MNPPVKHARIVGSLVMLGFGSIGQAMLPLLFRHLEIESRQLKIISADEDNTGIAAEFGVEFTVQTLTEGNYEAVLEGYVTDGDFLLNLSVDVSSLALMRFCWLRGALYLDTCIEPWAGRYRLRDKALGCERAHLADQDDLERSCSHPAGGRTNQGYR